MEKYIFIKTCDLNSSYKTQVCDTKEEAIDVMNKQVEKDVQALKKVNNDIRYDVYTISETEIALEHSFMNKYLYRIFKVNITELDKYKDLEAMLGIPFETMVALCNRIVPENCKYPKKTRNLTDETVDEWDQYKANRNNGLLFVLPYDIRKVKTLYYLDYDGKIYEVPKANTLTISVDDDGKITYTIRYFTFTEEEMKERVFTTEKEAEEKRKEIFGMDE